MATASCGEGRGGCVENEIMKDRLSSLPDEVAHHILSLSTQPHPLEMKDIALFSCASKRCRELVLSNPTLRFDDPCGSGSTCIKRLEVMNSLDRLLAHRGDNKLQLFDIIWYPHCSGNHSRTLCFCKNEIFRVITWIHNVLGRCKVEKLYLLIENCYYASVGHTFPSCIFHSESLRSLMVDFHCTIQVPSFAFSSNLKSLKLRFVTIVDEAFFKWISCCCKCIEDIYLDDVYGPKNVTIQSSSLESFHFEGAHSRDVCHLHISGEKLKEIVIDWSFDSPMNKSLNLFAPNLKKINWAGNLMNHPNLGKLVFLEEAAIRLRPRVDDWNNVFEVLCSLQGAKAVILNEKFIKVK